MSGHTGPVADAHTQDADPSGIRIDNLRMAYGGLLVFDSISLEVRDRETVSIVGPSGCGKTTLLKAIGGLIKPTGGTVRVGGAEVTSPPPGVGIVFQQFGLFPWKTIQDNVAYGLVTQGVGKREARERVHDYIRLVKLDGFEDSYPYQLSGGMQQRAGLARALAIEPRVLLMDEPFGALDALTREILQFELLNIWRARPTSMVFVTHSIPEAVLFGDRVAVMTGRPSFFRAMLDVPVERPRDRASLTADAFSEVQDEVWQLIMKSGDPELEGAGAGGSGGDGAAVSRTGP